MAPMLTLIGTSQDRRIIVDAPLETVYATVRASKWKDIHWLDTRAPLAIAVLLDIYFEMSVVLTAILQRTVHITLFWCVSVGGKYAEWIIHCFIVATQTITAYTDNKKMHNMVGFASVRSLLGTADLRMFVHFIVPVKNGIYAVAQEQRR